MEPLKIISVKEKLFDEQLGMIYLESSNKFYRFPQYNQNKFIQCRVVIFFNFFNFTLKCVELR